VQPLVSAKDRMMAAKFQAMRLKDAMIRRRSPWSHQVRAEGQILSIRNPSGK
jgi:hypothetical protein